MPSKNKLLKQQEKEEQREKEELEKILDEYWNQGTDKKGEKKSQLLNEKQMDKMKKTKDKQELMDLDEESTKNIKVNIRKSKKQKGDEFALLNQALANAPKTNFQKEAEKKALERKRQQERLEKERVEKEKKDKLLEQERKENERKGINYTHQDIMNFEINNTLNEEEETFMSGIDNILDTLNGNKEQEKYIFQDFYNEQIIILKTQNPGLRLSQYKDKIFNLWKKHPKNPKNI